jgi:Cu/Ag efflux pump CusA
MLSGIVLFSLRFRGIVVALAVLLLGYGLYVAAHAKLDVFPDFVPPEVTVQTEAPGLAPEQVETLVTRPVETAINGLGSQETIRSESIQGLSVITVVFKEGTNILQARQLLAEKLSETAGALPTGVRAPKMGPLVSATMDLLKIGLISDQLSPMELRTFVDWTLQPRMLAVSGVAHCNVFGGEVRQWQVQVHPDQLVAHNVSISDVLAAARQASGVRGAGFIETPGQRIVLQSEGQTLTLDALGGVVVSVGAGGAPVRLRDVATIAEGAEPKFGDALIMGKPGVLVTMTSQYGANTMEVTKGLEQALDELKPVFQREGITLYARLHRPATFIEASLTHIGHSLLLGAALVAVVLFLFLGHFRTAIISLLAIPLSLLATILILDRLGVTLNTITLGGLAIALGEVVDDAIIDVENILRRLRENRLLPRKDERLEGRDGRPARPGSTLDGAAADSSAALPSPQTQRSTLSVILDASIEVRHAIVYATCVVALVFVPVLTLTGLQGSFFAPLAQTYLLAITASLGVALTVTPALTLLLFPRGAKESAPPRLQMWLRRGYEKLLDWVSRHAVPVIGLVTLVCVLALSRLPFLGGEFLPEFREGHFVLGVSTAPGASLAETMRIGKHISEELLKNPNIATVEQQIGRAEQGEDTWGPQQSEFHVELKPDLPGKVQAQVEEEIRAVLDATPGIQSEVLTFLGDRIGESIGGETSPVVINLFGDDLDALDAKAAEVAAALGTVPGAADVQVKAPPGAPRLTVRLRSERVTALGLRPLDVLEAVQTAYEGEVVAQVYRGEQVSDIAVILDAASRRDPENVGDLLLTSLTGVRVPLRDVADVFLTSGRSSILHEGARRRQTVTCQPTGKDVQSFVAEARDIIANKVTLPAGMYLEYAGAAEAEAAATQQLLLHSAIAAVGIVLLLSVILGHWRNLLLVLINLPLALTGGVLAIYLSGLLGHSGGASTLTMGALIGFVTLFGITTRNAIMLVSHYEHLVVQEGQPWGLATAIRGASERLVPILMTASVTALGLFPLALGTGEAGREIEGPMAVVILGGLVTSALLNLLVLPTLALRFGRFGHKVTQ